MLAYKLLGGGLVILCGYAFGRGACLRQEHKLDRLEAIISLINHIRDMIDRYLMPLDRILAECDREMLDACGFSGDCYSLEELFESAKYLDAEIYDALRSFAAELGRGWRESQVKLCDRCLSILAREHERLSSDLPRARRAVMTLSMSLSAGITILLL